MSNYVLKLRTEATVGKYVCYQREQRIEFDAGDDDRAVFQSGIELGKELRRMSELTGQNEKDMLKRFEYTLFSPTERIVRADGCEFGGTA